MGIFQKIFGKEQCTLCGAECGALHRTKIKGGEYVCNDCARKCSAYVRLSEMDKAEVDGHIEYMRRQEQLYQQLFVNARLETFPTGVTKQGITFADELGMFTIIDRMSGKNKVNHELFRYDQVASYERYEEMNKPTEPGQPETLKERGIKLRLYGAADHIEMDETTSRRGFRSHPYVRREIKVVFQTSDNGTDYTDNAVAHFNAIFGVHDDENALFSFGMNKKEKRDLMGAIAFAKTAGTAVKVARDGEASLTDEKKAELQQQMNAMQDAQTGGLAEYTRRADAAEDKVFGGMNQ